VSGRARIAPDSVHVVPLGPAAALAWFRFRWVEGREGGGAVTLVYQREGSRWAIVHDQMSLSEKRVPPAETSRPPYDGPRPPATLPDSCVVARVSDGDTIECAPSGRIRLLGVDAPEMDQQANGTAARDALSRMIPPGTSLKLESDVTKRDRYSRVLAYLWLNGEQINWRLVREGWALAYRYEPDVRWAASLERAETLAREEKRGLWAVDGFSCRPEDRRRRAC
jgi:micrococcal nuclease